MNETVLQSIIAHLIGHKYYVNIVNSKGTNRIEISSYIFNSKAEAQEHRRQIESTASFMCVETVTFRSRNIYQIAQDKLSALNDKTTIIKF